jgi:hypothetical protein
MAFVSVERNEVRSISSTLSICVQLSEDTVSAQSLIASRIASICLVVRWIVWIMLASLSVALCATRAFV